MSDFSLSGAIRLNSEIKIHKNNINAVNKTLNENPVKTDDNVLNATDLKDVKSQKLSLVEYVVVQGAKGTEILDIKNMPIEDKKAFLNHLKDSILKASEKNPNDFKITDFVKMTSNSDLKIGKNSETTTKEITMNGEIKTAQDVLTRSNLNNKDTVKDIVFKWENGGETELNPKTKPGDFYNYQALGKQISLTNVKLGNEKDGKIPVTINGKTIEIDKNDLIKKEKEGFIVIVGRGLAKLPNDVKGEQVMVIHSSPNSTQSLTLNDKGETLLGNKEKNVANDQIVKTDFSLMKETIKHALDFNGLFSKINSADDFYKTLQNNPAVAERFKDNPALLKQMAAEIYSYAKTGQGTNGEIDLGKLQGITRLIDLEIQKTSESNTKFDEEVKNFPITKTTTLNDIPRGDAKLGRASDLELRHFGSNIQEKVTVTKETGEELSIKPPFEFNENDRFVKDGSPSMSKKMTAVRNYISNYFDMSSDKFNQKIDATFGEDSRVRIMGKEGYDGEDSGSVKEDYNKTLEKTIKVLYGSDTISEDKAKEFASMFKITNINDIFTKDSEGKYKLDGEKLMKKIGDVTKRGTDGGAHGESGLKGIISTLIYDESYGATANPKPRMNVAVDEPEQSMEYLQLAQALAQAKNIEVRILAFPTKAETINLHDPSSMTVIDLKDFKPDPNNFITRQESLGTGKKASETEYNTTINNNANAYDDKMYRWRPDQTTSRTTTE